MKRMLQIFILLGSINCTIGQTTFQNTEFGFSMQRPVDWQIANENDILKNYEAVDLTDEKLAQLIDTNKGRLILATYYKYERDINKFKGVNPTISISVLSNPTKSYDEFKNAIRSSEESYKEIVENFQYIQDISEIEITKHRGVASIYTYSIKIKDGQLLNVKTRSYAIPNGKYFLSIQFMEGDNEACTKEFDDLIKTIQINWEN